MELPDDLRQLEAALAGRPRPEPSPELRARVLGAVHSELARPVSRRTARRSFWSFAAGAAAVLFLGINLSISAANNTDFGFGRGPATGDLNEASARLREMAPELSEAEARRQALVLRGASRMVQVPAMQGSTGAARRAASIEEDN